MRAAPKRPAALAKRFIGAADIAKVFTSQDDPWDTQRARRWLLRVGIGHKHGGRVVTTLRQLTSLPGVDAEVFARLSDDEYERLVG